MTQTLTIRLPRELAQDLRRKAQAAKTTPSAVLRRMAADYVKSAKGPSRNALQDHIATHAGRWDGYCSGEELLRKTRP
jgi:predicted transcriptional regulator